MQGSKDYSDILITKRDTQEYMRQSGLKKSLSSSHLWSLCVGAVISGQFIGWNNGLKYVNPMGLIVLTIGFSIFYLLMMNILIKLSIEFPYSGGAYAYARKAFGKTTGFISGYITLIQYICISAVIYIFMERYLRVVLSIHISEGLSIFIVAIIAAVQVSGIKRLSFLQILTTGICVSIFLMFFMGIKTVGLENIPQTLQGIPSSVGFFMAVPFVLWFFVGIDSPTFVAEETKLPEIAYPISMYIGLITVSILSIGVIIFSVSSGNWERLVYTDYPLIFILHQLQQTDDVLLSVFSILSVSSFIASTSGLMTAYSRQTFALSRAGYLPNFISKIYFSTKVPFVAILIPSMLIILLGKFSNEDFLLQIVCNFAVLSYLLTSASFLKIERKDKSTRLEKLNAIITLSVSAILTAVFLVFQTYITIISMGIVLIGIIYFSVYARAHINDDAPEEAEANADEIRIKIINI